jgi:hypothetical protein
MDDFVILSMTVAIALIIFLFCREIVCWYFKINKTVELLEEIRDPLKNKS